MARILPPEPIGPHLLADGAYTDICPIHVARHFDCAVVAVNPGRSTVVDEIRNGLQELISGDGDLLPAPRALRFRPADALLLPPFRRPIDTLEFQAYRECVAAGIRAVRDSHHLLHQALRHGA